MEENGLSLVAAVAGEGAGPVAVLCLADCSEAAGSLVDCKQLAFHQDSNMAVLKHQAHAQSFSITDMYVLVCAYCIVYVCIPVFGLSRIVPGSMEDSAGTRT